MKTKLRSILVPFCVAFGVCALFLSMWCCTKCIALMNGSDDDILLGIFGLTVILTSLAMVMRRSARGWRKAVGNFITNLGSGIVLALALSGCVPGCERVDVGHVGIKVDLAGSGRGVQNLPIVTGYVWYNPMTQRVIEYPTFMQTAAWTKSSTEGGEANEEISFNSRDGLIITGDISLSYQLAPEQVPAFYVKFRSDDLDTFTHGYLRNVARDHFNDVAGTYAVEDLYGPKKEEFVHSVKERINREVASIGVRVEQFGFIGAPRPPQNVINAINAKIAATQQAMQVENEVRAVEAQARKDVAAAQGKASAAIEAAKGQAASRIAVAEGEAKANALLTASVTTTLLEWRRLEITSHAVDRWNGARPMVEGTSGGMLLQLPALTQK